MLNFIAGKTYPIHRELFLEEAVFIFKRQGYLVVIPLTAEALSITWIFVCFLEIWFYVSFFRIVFKLQCFNLYLLFIKTLRPPSSKKLTPVI